MAKIQISFSNVENLKKQVQNYLAIMSQIDPCESSFQTKFISFYKVIHRDKAWKESYFQIFSEERKKETPSSFEELLFKLYECVGRMEYSFTSKLIHTLDPTKPIWDQRVLTELGISRIPSHKSLKEKKKLAVEIYTELEDAYKEYLETADCKKQIERFDLAFPEAKEISALKKIDFLLWEQNREKKQK